jgi:hypothetical protein
VIPLFSTYFGSIQIFCTIRLTGHILYSGIEEKKYTKFRFFTVLDIQDIFYIPVFNKKLIPQNSGLCFPVSTKSVTWSQKKMKTGSHWDRVGSRWNPGEIGGISRDKRLKSGSVISFNIFLTKQEPYKNIFYENQ